MLTLQAVRDLVGHFGKQNQIVPTNSSGTNPWTNPLRDEEVSELVMKINGPLGTAVIGFHVVHTSRVIITYKLESLSSLA